MINLITTADEMHASYRYRTLVVAQDLLIHGIQVKVTPTFDIDATVCVYSKHWNYLDWMDALGAKALGKTIVFDCCDDHTETKHADHYRRMIEIADKVICNSDAMSRRIREVYKRAAAVIPDPVIELPLDRTPDLDRWCWVGHQTNYPSLLEWFPLIEDKDLTICTTHGTPVDRPGTRFVSWTPVSGPKVWEESGVCLVPYDKEMRRQCKSANRVIEALNKSCVVVSNGIDATRDLESFIEKHPADVGPDSIRKMEQGREYVRKRYSKERIGKLWRHELCD